MRGATKTFSLLFFSIRYFITHNFFFILRGAFYLFFFSIGYLITQNFFSIFGEAQNIFSILFLYSLFDYPKLFLYSFSLYRGSPTSKVSTSTNSTSTIFSAIGIKFVLYAISSPKTFSLFFFSIRYLITQNLFPIRFLYTLFHYPKVFLYSQRGPIFFSIHYFITQNFFSFIFLYSLLHYPIPKL
jgi:hypothetical protein